MLMMSWWYWLNEHFNSFHSEAVEWYLGFAWRNNQICHSFQMQISNSHQGVPSALLNLHAPPFFFFFIFSTRERAIKQRTQRIKTVHLPIAFLSFFPSTHLISLKLFGLHNSILFLLATSTCQFYLLNWFSTFFFYKSMCVGMPVQKVKMVATKHTMKFLPLLYVNWILAVWRWL